jgi:hypothetical protein
MTKYAHDKEKAFTDLICLLGSLRAADRWAKRIRCKKWLEADANDLILQMGTWERHDVGTTPGFGADVERALRSIKVPLLYMPSETDLYFPVGDARYDCSFVSDHVGCNDRWTQLLGKIRKTPGRRIRACAHTLRRLHNVVVAVRSHRCQRGTKAAEQSDTRKAAIKLVC